MFPLTPPPPERLPTEPEQVEPEMDEVDLLLYDPVLRYRAEQFRLCGFNLRQSRKLALDKSVDLHDTRQLIKAGCDVLTAFDIVS